MEMVAAGLRILRPHSEVEGTTIEAFVEALARLDPQWVFRNGHESVESARRMAWIELSLDPTRPTKISVGGHYFERINPTVEELLEIIDELE